MTNNVCIVPLSSCSFIFNYIISDCFVDLSAWKEIYLFVLFCFVFEGTVFKYKPLGADIQRGDLTEGFLRYGFEGLLFGGAYTWRGLFSEFYDN